MKKIISFLITLIICFNFLPCSSVCLASAVAEAENSFELLSALNIDRNINTDNSAPVTRAEFAAMVVRAVNMDKAISVHDGSFEDVPDTHIFANEIYIAKDLKMTNGTSSNKFSPDGTVDKNVALKMTLIAMGYETMAVTYGGWPLGYSIIESQLDITSGISTNENLTVGDAKLIITNALKEDVAVFSGIEDGNFIYTTNKGVNLLTERFNMRKISGIVSKAGYISADKTFSNDNILRISGESYQCLVDCYSYFGMNVDAWVGKDDNKVYAVEDNGISKTIEIEASMIDSFNNNKLTVYEGYKTKTYKTDGGLLFIENGRVIYHDNSAFKFSDGKLKLIDSENDGIFDYAIAEKTQYFVISGINSADEIIYDKNSPLGLIELEESDDCVRLIEGSNGNCIPFSDLEIGMVVEVINSYDSKVSVVRISESKKLDAVVTEIGNKIVIADGIEYATNTYFENSGINLVLNKKYTLYIAGDNTLTYAEDVSDGSISYGFYLGFGRQTGLNAKAVIKILTASNQVKTYELADKLTLDGDPVNYTDSRLENVLINGEHYKYRLIRYCANNEGLITMIDTDDGTVKTDWERDEGAQYDNNLTKYLDGKSVNYRGGSGFGAPSFSFTRGTIFVAPTQLRVNSAADYPDEAFEVMDYSSLQNNKNYTVDVYDFDEYYYPKAIVVYQDTTGGTVSSQSATHFVYSVTDAVNMDGETTKLIRSYSKGKYYKYYVSPDILEKSTMPKPGDMVRYALDYNNYIKKVNIDAQYNASAKNVNILYNGEYNGEIAYISGNVKNIGEKSLVLRANSAPTTLQNTSNIAPLPLGNVNYAIYDAANGTIEKCSIYDVLTEELVGKSSSSYVLCRLNYYAVTDVIIYKH